MAPARPHRQRGQRRPAPALLLAPLLGLLVAGCAGDGGGEGDAADAAGAPPGGAGPAGPSAGLPRPDWAVGDAWTYTVNGEAATYVVASETATEWIMETDSAERAFADLRDDVSRLGPQRKADLAGSQGDARVEFFRWPLTDGATWTTTWDGQPVTIQALVALQRADLTATDAEGRLVYRYSYDAESRWFTELRHYAPDGGELVGLVLQSAVRNWTGTLVRWEVGGGFEGGGDGDIPLAVSGTLEVPAGVTDLWMEYHLACTGFAGFSVLVEPLNPGLAAQQRMEDSGPCTQVDRAEPILPAPHPGTWAFSITAGGERVVYEYALLVRTRVDVPFPAA